MNAADQLASLLTVVVGGTSSTCRLRDYRDIADGRTTRWPRSRWANTSALREHYVLTARAWSQTLDRRWAEAVALVGEPVARIWRLYLAGGALAFAERRMGVDQILAVRPTETGGSGMAAVRKESRC
jgi:cyclopropane fatty-acyl-phospholipid synthase-like methyltransferase